MTDYRPANAYQWLLARVGRWPNLLGASARRKLRRAWAARTLADFEDELRCLGPDDIALDLGANIGTFTRRLAATGAMVHAFEPDPDTFARLKEACGDLPNVVLHQAAVGATNGTVRLYRAPSDRRADYSEMASTVFSTSRQYRAETIDVEQRAFADILDALPGPASLIKMDIEGAEFDILREIFRDPCRWTFGALFVETHETRALDQIPAIDKMRTVAASLARPRINLYWP
ncbi:FkbM family methyltransferase [Frigidibacter sp. SD6-1]|uniref:FkbM family methyltransferase n=1 Tax=Frigidibacter sp. SD6-1 TaxID=3032581 RepID=UPI0024DF40CF|nr:FkbM family methyltransferase [Frigidibacter sp. SD6-1]